MEGQGQGHDSPKRKKMRMGGMDEDGDGDGMGDLLQISIVRVVLVELCTSIQWYSAIQYWSHGMASIQLQYNRVIQQVDYTRCYSTILCSHTRSHTRSHTTPPRSAYSCMVEVRGVRDGTSVIHPPPTSPPPKHRITPPQPPPNPHTQLPYLPRTSLVPPSYPPISLGLQALSPASASANLGDRGPIHAPVLTVLVYPFYPPSVLANCMRVTGKCEVTYFLGLVVVGGIGVDRSGRSFLLLLAVVSYHGAEDDGGVSVLVPLRDSVVVFSACVDTLCMCGCLRWWVSSWWSSSVQ